MTPTEAPPGLTPLQRVIFKTDQLDLSLRDSIKIATARMGFFVGQHKYLEERGKISRILGQDGPALVADS